MKWFKKKPQQEACTGCSLLSAQLVAVSSLIRILAEQVKDLRERMTALEKETTHLEEDQ